jgi:tetratricopeptide (TPR) repeat protein
VSEAVYERYKEALRRGHVAALRGRLDDALAAYAEAASIAPERPLPYASMGGVQLRLGRLDDALASYDAALDRAPRDESALIGRAEALSRTGRRTEAAEALDLASDVQAADGRRVDALESARRSLELAESRARRRHVRRLIEEVREGEVEGAEEAIARASAVLEAADRLPAPSEDAPEAGDASASPEAGEAGDASASPEAGGAEGTEAAESWAAAVMPPAEPSGPSAVGQAARSAAEAVAPSADVGVPPDPIELTLAADRAIASGDRVAARDALLAAAAGDAGAGLTDSALDACYRALAVAPDDPDLHLALVDLYVARGWTALAARKLALLERLVTLDGDEVALGQVRSRAASAFLDAGRPDEAASIGT